MTAAPSAEAPPSSLISQLLADEIYRPSLPRTWKEAGLSTLLVEALVCKYLAAVGADTGRGIAGKLCLPFALMEQIYSSLRTRQILVHGGAAPLGDYTYKLTESGRDRAVACERACAYVGAAPVPLNDYAVSVEAQTIRAEATKQRHLREACRNISAPPELMDDLGPAINSAAGLLLYGPPGNGKSTIARCITLCFGQHIWVPRTLIDDGQLIKFYDPAHHEVVRTPAAAAKEEDFDTRWIRIRRPTVVVGGELTMEALEIRHDPRSNVSEAPLQLKSNCGCLLIDDFGRQRIEPKDLLNRWIVPLEHRCDYLTLCSGKKIEVPFEQLVIFSTNLNPDELVDEAFLRRIPYKINVADPGQEEFLRLFEAYGKKVGCAFRREAVLQLLEVHYFRVGRPLRRCHPRDLLLQIRNYCAYYDLPVEMKFEYLDQAARTYFGSGLKMAMKDMPV